jgi:hypothetical protein
MRQQHEASLRVCLHTQFTLRRICDPKLQIFSAEVVKLVGEVGLENHVGDANQSYLKR